MSNTQNSNSVQMITKLIVRCFVSAGEQLEALTVSEGKRQTRGRTQSCRLALCVCVCVCMCVCMRLAHKTKLGPTSPLNLVFQWCSHPLHAGGKGMKKSKKKVTWVCGW